MRVILNFLNHVKCTRLFSRVCIVSLMLSASMAVVFAQQATIRGVVVDETGEGAVGVNITEKGTFNGGITSVDGSFSITVANGQTAVLQFSYIGYRTMEETVGGRTTLNVTIEPAVINLGEAVVIGYGTQTRREITGSVVNISEEIGRASCRERV